MTARRQLLGALDHALGPHMPAPVCSRCGGPPDENGCAVALVDPAEVERISECEECRSTLDFEGQPLGARNPDGSVRLHFMVFSKEDQAILVAQDDIEPELST